MVRTVPTTTDPDVRKAWGDELRLARLARRQTQVEIGDAVGLAGPTVARAENGRGSLDIYDRLARHLGVTLTAGEGS
jgi:transcriptional regulator with XRE-family HTH domain